MRRSDECLTLLDRTTLWSVGITRGWLRSCTNVCNETPFHRLPLPNIRHRLKALVEPSAMPGNTSFVAGFVQGIYTYIPTNRNVVSDFSGIPF